MSACIHGDSARTLVCDVMIDPISPPRSGFKKHSKQAEALQKKGQDSSIFWISRSWRCSTPTATTPPLNHGHVDPSNSQQDLNCWHWKYNRNRQHLWGWQYNWHTNQCTQSYDHLHNYGWACFFWRRWLSSANSSTHQWNVFVGTPQLTINPTQHHLHSQYGATGLGVSTERHHQCKVQICGPSGSLIGGQLWHNLVQEKAN